MLKRPIHRPGTLKVSPGVADNSRINSLTDGTFAIVLTLLAFSLQLPDLPPESVARELPQALWAMGPDVVSLTIGFVVVGIYWVGHHNLFVHIHRHDRILLWLNLGFLLFVTLVPFPAGLLVRYRTEQMPVGVLSIVLILAGLMLDLIWLYASRQKLVDPTLPGHLVGTIHKRILTGPAIYLLALGVSFFSVTAATLLFLVAVAFYILPAGLDILRHRHLDQRQSASSSDDSTPIEDEP